jgi:ABC-type multidrug transport system ATPase subunit
MDVGVLSSDTGSYVVQDDKLMPNLTVYETLSYAAQLRHVQSRQAIEELTHNALLEMELVHIKDSRVGDDYVRGISGGQRRRCVVTWGIVARLILSQRQHCSSAADGPSRAVA